YSLRLRQQSAHNAPLPATCGPVLSQTPSSLKPHHLAGSHVVRDTPARTSTTPHLTYSSSSSSFHLPINVSNQILTGAGYGRTGHGNDAQQWDTSCHGSSPGTL